MNLSSANNRIRHNATELKKLGFTVFFTLYGTGEGWWAHHPKGIYQYWLDADCSEAIKEGIKFSLPVENLQQKINFNNQK